jgi:two-component system, chemotaxis family, chemotaxis protein CheY
VLATRNPKINIAGLSFLLADPNPHSTAIIHSILRGFGANRVVEVRNNRDAMQVLSEQKIDLMMVEPNLPKGGGLAFIRSIRQDHNSPCRTLPILVVSGDTRTSMVKSARDCGANMVIAKPMSPASLYERLAWVAFRPRKFIETATYFGPDRRFKIEGLPNGKGRRAGDNEVEIKAEEGPTLSQDDIDSLLAEARVGGAA